MPHGEGLTLKASHCCGWRYRVDPKLSDCSVPEDVVCYCPGENIYVVKHPKGHP